MVNAVAGPPKPEGGGAKRSRIRSGRQLDERRSCAAGACDDPNQPFGRPLSQAHVFAECRFRALGTFVNWMTKRRALLAASSLGNASATSGSKRTKFVPSR